MKFKQYFLTICILFSSTKTTFAHSEALDKHWDNYKRDFGITYSAEEENGKRQNWESRVHEIILHNLEYMTGNHPYCRGVNKYSDMDNDTFMKHMTGFDSNIPCARACETYQIPKDVDVPESWDWRNKGYVTEAKDQGECGACWAFASTGSLEGQNKRKTGKLVSLSEQNLIDCSTVTGNKGCNGGHICTALEYVVKNGGVDTEAYYPYQDRQLQCRYNENEKGSNCVGFKEIPSGDEQALLYAVATHGPVAAGFNANPSGFHNYKGGIFDDPSCSNTTLSHAVTVIGYGVRNGVDYWLIKNSWGSSWGDNGFGMIARNKNNMCAIATKAYLPFI